MPLSWMSSWSFLPRKLSCSSVLGNRLEWVAPVDKFLQRSSFRRHNWTFEYNSDVFGLATLVMSVGELEFGQQTILFLSSLLKRIDRLLQFESEPLYRLMRG
ncbi:hypothetical protein MLD38_037131 [Melastoma candidum]|uniref:Uncharacterized protein n=1 Tax=Melastoma candidum TaxID=119954 RepID=A0ACB9LLX3_9MYRT|nr:hypothetical protein MLD38_037131 [Melastoma candidum]